MHKKGEVAYDYQTLKCQLAKKYLLITAKPAKEKRKIKSNQPAAVLKSNKDRVELKKLLSDFSLAGLKNKYMSFISNC